MLINTFLDTEDFVHLYYEEEGSVGAQGCGAGARMASKMQQRPPSPSHTPTPSYTQFPAPADMTDGRERCRPPPQPEPPPHRVRAADLYPRLRTHYDEPGLDIGFTPICGEFVQWVGRTADGGTVAMSNYRLHVQPRRRSGPGASVPLRLIDAAEIRDLIYLVVLCKHGQQLKCSFTTGDQCMEWWRRLNNGLQPLGSVQETFAAAYAAWAKEQPPASVHRALMRASHAPQRHWFGPEVERLEFTSKGAWRVTAANAEYKLCPSYPPLLVVPATIGDEDLDSVARFRAMRRVPAVVWRHRGNGAVIARSSQPEVGWLGWRSSEDERLLAAFVSACVADRGLQPANTNKQIKLLIVDARSYASAVTNRARGGGCECQQYYPNADIQFMCLPNIHHVRRSFQQMRALTAEPSDQTNWHSNLERTLWLQYVSGVLRAAGVAARAVLAGRPVLVHCSDGWDRTPQIVAAAQLLLDPYYRTIEGFRVLVEREWLDFGHKFADRCGHQFGPEEPNERSPIFLQWLDTVHQLLHQYPCSFQFNEAYLIKLATHVHSCMFGTFLCNSSRERLDARVPDTTAHVWHLLRAPAYTNHLYSPPAAPGPDPHHDEQVLWPEVGVRYMRVWGAMFTGQQSPPAPAPAPAPAAPPAHAPPRPHTGLMTKTRSCDNLPGEAERRNTARRSSDPSLAPDLAKLSSLCRGAGAGAGAGALTDSCVDDLPVLPLHHHTHAPGHIGTETDTASDSDQQVDGLHPDHFERSPPPAPLAPPVHPATLPAPPAPTAPASTSSSLERELVAATSTHRPDTEGDGGGESPDETDFVQHQYNDLVARQELAREAGRARNVSITWRSISESSNQSSTFSGAGGADPPSHESTPPTPPTPPSPLDNHNSTDGDLLNHNVPHLALPTAHTAPTAPAGVLNGGAGVNGVHDGIDAVDGVNMRFLEVDLNGGATSSSVSSESEGDALLLAAGGGVGGGGGAGRARQASQLTLCPAPLSPPPAASAPAHTARAPRPRRACCHCDTLNHGDSDSPGSSHPPACWCGACGRGAGSGAGSGGGGRARCVCGAGAGAGGGGAELDGLPPALDPLQARLHQIILYQKKVVEELSGQLRSAREALRRAQPPAHPAAPAAHPHPHAHAHAHAHATHALTPHAPGNEHAQMVCSSGSARSGSVSSSGSGSGSGSGSEVEVGEEARGVVWVPDHAAPRCQHCRNHFWLARRRHHCRRCGGIFCGSCSEISSWGDCAVRMCRRCRALR